MLWLTVKLPRLPGQVTQHVALLANVEMIDTNSEVPELSIVRHGPHAGFFDSALHLFRLVRKLELHDDVCFLGPEHDEVPGGPVNLKSDLMFVIVHSCLRLYLFDQLEQFIRFGQSFLACLGLP